MAIFSSKKEQENKTGVKETFGPVLKSFGLTEKETPETRESVGGDFDGVFGKFGVSIDSSTQEVTEPKEPTNLIKVSIPEDSDLAVKMNNPGNLEFREQRGASVGPGGRWARFNSPEEGFTALVNQVIVDTKRDMNLQDFINKYAPPEENETRDYLNSVSNNLGVSKDTPLSEINPIDLAEEVAHHESGAQVEYVGKPLEQVSQDIGLEGVFEGFNIGPSEEKKREKTIKEVEQDLKDRFLFQPVIDFTSDKTKDLFKSLVNGYVGLRLPQLRAEQTREDLRESISPKNKLEKNREEKIKEVNGLDAGDIENFAVEFVQGLKRLPDNIAINLLGRLNGPENALPPSRSEGYQEFINLVNKDTQRAINEAKKRFETQDFLPGLGVEIAKLPKNAAFTVAAGGEAILKSLPGALTGPYAPFVMRGLALQGAGKSAFEMASHDLMRAYLTVKEQDKGEDLTDEEIKTFRNEFMTKAEQAGLWEALPEAISQVFMFDALVLGPLKKMLGKTLAQKVASMSGRLVSAFTVEEATETITEMGQTATVQDTALDVTPGDVDWTDPNDWWTMAKRVFPQTALITGLFAGVGGVGLTAKKTAKLALEKEAGSNTELYDKFVEKIENDRIQQVKKQALKGEEITGERPSEIRKMPEPEIGEFDSEQEARKRIEEAKRIEEERQKEIDGLSKQLEKSETGEGIEVVGFQGIAPGNADTGFRTPNKEVAAQYAVTRGKEGIVRTIREKLENPLVLDNRIELLNEIAEQEEGDKSKLAEQLLTAREDVIKKKGGIGPRDDITRAIDQFVKDHAKSQGHDSVIFKEGNVYMVTEPGQNTVGRTVAEGEFGETVEGVDVSKGEAVATARSTLNNVKNKLQEILNADIEVKEVRVIGSRVVDEETGSREIEVGVEYSGLIDEDTLYIGIKNEDQATINGVPIEITPVRERETGNIDNLIKEREAKRIRKEKRKKFRERATEEVIEELKASEPGRRSLVKPEGASVNEIYTISEPSTFPRWIPPELRRTPLFEKVIKHLEEGTKPKEDTRADRLYKIVQKEIEKYFKGEREIVGPPTNRKSYDMSIGQSRPEIARMREAGYRWDALNRNEKIAVKYWVEQGKEGIPPSIKQDLAERGASRALDSVEDPDNMDIDSYVASKDEAEGVVPNKDTRSKLMLKVDPYFALKKLSKVARRFGLPGIKIEELKSSGGGLTQGRFSYNADGPVSVTVKNIQDLITLGHEIGHLFDVAVIGQNQKGEYIAITTIKGRFKGDVDADTMLRELKNVQKIVGPFRKDSDRRELFADWFTIYLNDYEKAKTFSPKFTEQMEKEYGNELDWIRSIYQFPAEHVSPRDMSESSKKKIRDGVSAVFNRLKGEKPNTDVEVEGWLEETKKKVKLSFWRNFNIPFWIAHKEPSIKPLFKAVQETMVRDKQGREVEQTREAGILEYHRNLSDQQKAKLAMALWQGNDRDVQSEWAESTLKSRFGMDHETIQAYKRYRRGWDRVLKNTIEAWKYKYGFYELEEGSPERQEMEDWIKSQLDKNKGYVSMKRQGKWRVYGEFVDNQGNETIVYEGFASRKKATKYANAIREAGYNNVEAKKKHNLSSGAYRKLQTMASWQVVEGIAEKAGIDPNNNDVQAIIKELKKSGMNKTLLTRSYVPGKIQNYETARDGLLSSIEESNRMLAKEKTKYLGNKAIQEIDKSKTEVRAYAREYLDATFKNTGGEFALFRQTQYFWYLGWKFSFLAQNLTQPMLTLVPEIANQVQEESGFMEGMKAPVKIMKKSTLMMFRYYYNRGMTSLPEWSWLSDKKREQIQKFVDRAKSEVDDAEYKEYEKLMDKGIDQGVVAGNFQKTIMGIQQQRANKLQNALGLFAIASEMANRGLSFAAAHQIAKHHKKMTNLDEMFEFAKEIDDRTNFGYNEQNVPLVLKRGNRAVRGIIRTMFIFKTFYLNYLPFLNQRVRKGNAAARTWTIPGAVLFSGIKFVPFLLLFNWGYKALSTLLGGSGEGFREELYKHFNEDEEWVADVIMNGLMTQLNMDTSSLVGMGDLMNPEWGMANQLVGPTAGLIDDVSYAYYLVSTGDTERAAEKLTPYVVGNVLAAKRWSERGITFKEGVNYKPSKFEIFKKSIGFTPHSISKEYQLMNIVDQKTNRYNRVRRKYQNTVKGLLRDGATRSEIAQDKSYKNVLEEVKEHNMNVEDSLYAVLEGAPIEMPRDEYNSLYKKLVAEYKDINNWYEDAREEVSAFE